MPRGVELEKSPQAAEPTEASAAAGKGFSDRERRIIKRYSNRKLYDTRDSRYVTLLQIAEMIRAGGDVQIIDNATKEDKTEVTLALIISEELKSQPRSVPLGTLRNLIHQRGERFLSQLRDGPIGRLIPGVVETKAGGEGVPGTEGGAPSVQTDETGQVIATPERAADAAALDPTSSAKAAAASDGSAQPCAEGATVDPLTERAPPLAAQSSPLRPCAEPAAIESLKEELARLTARVESLEARLAAASDSSKAS